MEKTGKHLTPVKQRKDKFFGQSEQSSFSAKGNFIPPIARKKNAEAKSTIQEKENPDTIQENISVSKTAQMQQAQTTAPSGNDFNTYMTQLRIAETAAQGDGYGTDRIVAAVRKLYYDGGNWNRVIAGSANVGFPPSWTSNPDTQSAVDYVREHQVININGQQVDIGHLLTGIDARRHLAGVSFAGGIVSMRSNQEVATFVGDVGSAVKHYVDNERRFYQIVVSRDDGKLKRYYDQYASAPDMAGNADAYSMNWDASRTLTENMQTYYNNVGGTGENRRYTNFCRAIGLGNLAGGAFTGDTPAWREAIKNEIYNFAIAYHFGQDGKFVGMFTWEGTINYARGAEWMTDVFVIDMVQKVSAENTGGGGAGGQ